MLHVIAVLLICIFSLSTTWAARLASFCYLLDQSPEAVVEGQNIDQRLPIASVSKVITSWWAMGSVGPNYQMSTRIYITPVSNDPHRKVVDIHFAGARDPYFGKESLHYLISELNKQKIYRLRNVTFDDEFKFFWNAGGGPMLSKANNVETGYYYANSPTPKEVHAELKRYSRNWTYGYSNTAAYLKKFNILLVSQPRITVENIAYVPVRDFVPSPQTQVRTIRSSLMFQMLREMNRNSNNHAASQIFEHLGGNEEFNKYIAKSGFTEAQIRIVNGHGNRHDREDKTSIYNEASCATVVKIVKSLRKNLQRHGKDLPDVMAVPGLKERSTLGAYSNPAYSQAVTAKTGTVNPAVTLAGMLQTKKGPVYFMYIMSTRSSESDWSSARRAIAYQLSLLTKKFDGGVSLNAQALKFISFDPELFFQAEKHSEAEEPVPAELMQKQMVAMLTGP